MAAAYESDGGVVFAAANNNNAISIPLPATRPAGSVLLFIAFCRLITAAAPAPSGYSLLSTLTSGTASGGRIWVYAKEVVGGETAPSVTPAGVTGTSGDLWGAGIICYSGVDLSGGISAILDGTPTTTDAAGTTTCTYPALTISGADSMLVRFLARFRDAADTFTPTATWNEREDIGSTNRTGGQFHLQDKLATASGSQATVTVAPSNTTSSRYLAVTLALKAELPPVPADETVLDNFNRADGKVEAGAGATIWNGSWYNDVTATDLRVISNQLGSVVSSFQAAHTKARFAKDCDILIDCVVAPVTPNFEFGLFFLMVDQGTPTFDSYAVFYSAGTWILRRYLDGANVGNITTAAGSLLAGDSIWVYKRGSTLRLYRKPAAGSYAQVLTATDANIDVAGVVALELSDTSQRWDNLRGGPMAPPLQPERARANRPRQASVRAAVR